MTKAAAPAAPDASIPAHSNPHVIDKRWSISIPLVIMIATIIVANLKLFYDVQTKTDILGEKVTAVAADVSEMKGLISTFTAETSTELRSLRAELTGLKVELAVLRERTGQK